LIDKIRKKKENVSFNFVVPCERGRFPTRWRFGCFLLREGGRLLDFVRPNLLLLLRNFHLVFKSNQKYKSHSYNR
jgi:hypothetical protein